MKNILISLLATIVAFQLSAAQVLTVSDPAGKVIATGILSERKVTYFNRIGASLGDITISVGGAEYQSKYGIKIGKAKFYSDFGIYYDSSDKITLYAFQTGQTTTYQKPDGGIVLKAVTQNHEIIYRDANGKELARTSFKSKPVFKGIDGNVQKSAPDLFNVFDDVIIALALDITSLPVQSYATLPAIPAPAASAPVSSYVPSSTYSSTGTSYNYDPGTGSTTTETIYIYDPGSNYYDYSTNTTIYSKPSSRPNKPTPPRPPANRPPHSGNSGKKNDHFPPRHDSNKDHGKTPPRGPQPGKNHDKTPPRGNVTPPQQSRPTPPQQSRPTPPTQNRPTPPQQSKPTPPTQNRPTPPPQNRPTPPQQSRPTPPQQSRPTPPQQSRPTPPTQNRPTPPTQNRPTPPQQSKPTPPPQNRPTPPPQSRPTPPQHVPNQNISSQRNNPAGSSVRPGTRGNENPSDKPPQKRK